MKFVSVRERKYKFYYEPYIIFMRDTQNFTIELQIEANTICKTFFVSKNKEGTIWAFIWKEILGLKTHIHIEIYSYTPKTKEHENYFVKLD